MRAGLAAGLAGLFALGSLGVAAAEPTAADRYVLNCSGCHRLDGAGIPGFAPSLYDLAGLAGTEAGRAYLVGVPGVAQAPIADADLAGLLDWVVARFSGLPIEPRFDARRVAAWRVEPLRDPAAARARLVATGADSGPRGFASRPGPLGFRSRPSVPIHGARARGRAARRVDDRSHGATVRGSGDRLP